MAQHRTPARQTFSVRVRDDLATWLEEQAESRLVSRNYLVEVALDRLRSSLDSEVAA